MTMTTTTNWMTVEEANMVLDRIQYMHGGDGEATFQVDEIDGVTTLSLTVYCLNSNDERLFDEPGILPDGVFPVPVVTSIVVGGYEMSDPNRLVRAALHIACQFAAHEAAEWFRVDDAQLFDPHGDYGNVDVHLPHFPMPGDDQ